MRALLSLLVLFALTSVAGAQPAWDSTCTATACLAQATGGTTVSVTASSSSSNDLIVVGVVGGTTTASGTPITFTVAGCGLSWTRRSRQSGLNSTNIPFDSEQWTAVAASALSSCSITATADRTIDDAVIGYFAVHGVNSTTAPFDANASLPTKFQNLTASNTSVAGTITTSQANDFVYSLAASVVGSCTDVAAGTPPGGQGTLIGGKANSGGTNWACLQMQFWRVTSTQSATAWGITRTTNNWFYLIDAMTADAATKRGHFVPSFP